MKKIIILIALITITNTVYGVTVDGYAYLENQTEHDSIEVYFEMNVPNDSTYSVYTDNSGYYNVEIAGGIYDINFSYNDSSYIDYFILSSMILYSNTTLENVILVQHPFLIEVPSMYSEIQEAINLCYDGDTVLIDTGTYNENINFNGKNIVVASKYLITQDTTYISNTIIDGNENGSVVSFENSEDSTAVLIGFSIINGSVSGNFPNNCGGGIFCSFSSPFLSHLQITNNVTNNHGYGGGIFCDNSFMKLENTLIKNNSSFGGGGFYCRYSTTELDNVIIKNNVTDDYGYGAGIYSNSSDLSLSAIIIENNIAYDSGGGIYSNDSNQFLNNVYIRENEAERGGGIYSYNSEINSKNIAIENNNAIYGGGIYCSNSSSNLFNTFIRENTASKGGGLYFQESNSKLYNSIINNNSSMKGGGGFCTNDSEPSFINTLLANNSASNQGGGLFCNNNSNPYLLNSVTSFNTGDYGIYVISGDPTIEYCDFYNNEVGNFFGCNQYIGQNVTTNTNGDSCDAFYNIQMDPCFIDTTNEDFHLIEISPCIDAGIPDFIGLNLPPWDLDGNIRIWDGNDDGTAIIDMGPYEYDASIYAIGDQPQDITKKNFINYPNPITAKSNKINIRFSLKKPSKVDIKLYNIKGQMVAEIFSNNKPSGTHTVSSNINNLASGIYFIKMDVDGKNRAVKKMVKIE